MSLVIVGSVAFDTIETPEAKRERVIGGACTYSAISASYFVKPYIVGVVGRDFTSKHFSILHKKKIDTRGVKREDGKSFFWAGKYHQDMNNRDTLITELNVFEKFDPVLPPDYTQMPFLFLANIDPPLQLKVLKAMKKLKFSMVDTMNLWIDIKRKELTEVFKNVDCVVLNDAEIRMYTGKSNLIEGAKAIQKTGPKYVIIKKGEHGASIVGKKGEYFSCPSYPVEKLVDPTGAGDSFAGAFMGYAAKTGSVTFPVLKKALVCGSAAASFTVEGFSIDKIYKASAAKIMARTASIKKISSF